MENKICKKCNIEKSIDEFRIKRNQCRECERNICKQYHIDNKEKLNDKSKNYYHNNKEHCAELAKLYRETNSDKIKTLTNDWREKNKDYIKEYQKTYNENNSEKIKEHRKNYRIENKDKIKAYRDDNKEKQTEYYVKNQEKIKAYQKEYRIDNIDKINENKRIYTKKRKANDPLFNLSTSFRTNLGKTFKKYGYRKISKTSQILGCSFDEFKIHLESQFEDWMNWGNKGLYNGTLNYGWDIDHKIPLSSAKTEEELITLLHYTNCQPLCSKINRDIKKDSLDF